ncbi:MAG: RsmB/NOP family class I SAM-dependent RNA methyltransferase [Planctomycetota bacterium]
MLSASEETARPLDTLLGGFFRDHRELSDADRQAVASLVHRVLRRRAQLDWWIERARDADIALADEPIDWPDRVLASLVLEAGLELPAIASAFGLALDLDAAEDADGALPEYALMLARKLARQTIDHVEQPLAVRANLPAWLEAQLRARLGDAADGEFNCLLEEAPVDVRVNTLLTTRVALAEALRARGIACQETPHSPLGLRLNGRPALGRLEVFEKGWFEVQDEGSQLAALLVGVSRGQRVCDLCAGAGGKTLALAALMENRGSIIACDTSERRLKETTRRQRRANVHNVQCVPLATERDPYLRRHKRAFDRVLVDAPCTGTGTLRRNPDRRFNLLPEDIVDLAGRQSALLDLAAPLVKPGGRLVYSTCSLLREENEAQVDRFLNAQAAEFTLVPFGETWRAVGCTSAPPTTEACLQLQSARDGTDGFFVAIFARK